MTTRYALRSALLSHDLGIDLGTSNFSVYVRGRGIVLNAPSVVAVNTKEGAILAVGAKAKRMLGRTPPHRNWPPTSWKRASS